MSEVGKQLVMMPQQASANPLMFCGPQADLVKGSALSGCVIPRFFKNCPALEYYRCSSLN
ncbi:MAG: hypothetical protein MRQ11_01720 [Candidatus Midichloria mitochondrii]|uniref:Uncharacterized protein n=1 Tax=Midichloria mitochondrii (strain IricVA) TaxID=696127 RepID=F7XV53_MIDMI|nr:hypothetical protein midi_00235 [Candidatus Midichloria mitochondrii IricVA]MDJ1256128.1 hypothetical protein [Candidatus Midichloria mitochondrii]MDJ1287823.1 hypothetical protein [Candidatus Midichloria mitochondrii]MDJ1583410.1 hypothetical protein [Candidatus Midichloria mitochondrii]